MVLISLALTTFLKRTKYENFATTYSQKKHTRSVKTLCLQHLSVEAAGMSAQVHFCLPVTGLTWHNCPQFAERCVVLITCKLSQKWVKHKYCLAQISLPWQETFPTAYDVALFPAWSCFLWGHPRIRGWICSLCLFVCPLINILFSKWLLGTER